MGGAVVSVIWSEIMQYVFAVVYTCNLDILMMAHPVHECNYLTDYIFELKEHVTLHHKQNS